MAKPKRLRKFVGLLKDKMSLFKATLLLAAPRTSSLHVAVLRATSHNPSHAPPNETVDDVLALGRPAAGALVHALLHRVHHTSNAYVALKCLLTIHHLISRGSHVINDQIVCLSRDGPLFGLSTFRDQSDDDTWELSNWVRWYAVVLDQNISLQSKNSISLNFFIIFLEKICGAPESLHYQKISLIYEVMKLIVEDYRLIMREIQGKVEEFSTKIDEFSDESLNKFLGDLKRIENCKEKLLLMFLNKKKNDGFWELIEKVVKNVEEIKQQRESMKMVNFRGSESTRPSQVDESRSIVVASVPRVKRWLDVEWNKLVVSSTA
ncbi:hypothetical protein RND81_02G095600 [Saponaria officinalis]|uniref:ENTH domain-containing protein n=1 Tax=Saponaria officinalis TaxID=3572 RepID=A0AAW1MRN9_SAPOF